ncbi:alpha/beta hydrolase [Nocardia goodfellowii]|uniref:Pimeloyl-ACP methyl ester carboxylesterase n=1 Tax=Nocardia goodfellowii TaxID=882446 RepID=A0ABS4QA72_9NOCA|nr:alpha/beta hydrolase [Nocardia goodfellowii]MBP2188473.1 pimeloyl-ACP methyl ester carboxylesterase [Nocardia goodfellowii]
MTLSRNISGALLAAVLGSGALAACTSTAAPEPALTWQPCAENGAYECASLTVPIDWSNPDGGTIDVAVVRDSADGADKVGTLISLPGGPGSSGVDQIMRGTTFSTELESRFDIVSLDPRGVKRSQAVRCDAGLVARWPNLVPDAGGRLAEVHSYARELEASCREHTGPLLDHLDAESLARDVEALRKALGESQISLYSRSYGTMPAQRYAELFPGQLRASLLDSVDDHSLGGADFLASQARAGQNTFTEFVAWCARETQCALHGSDVPGLYGDLFATAARGELRQIDGKPLPPVDLSSAVTQRLYRPEWPELAKDLRALAAQPRGAAELPVPPRRTGEIAPMPQIIFCSDWQFDIADEAQWQRLWRAQQDNAPTLRVHFAWAAGSICSGWPVATKNPPHRPLIQGGPPTLILNSRHDPATPHEWALQVAAQTPGARLLSYDGWGHGMYDRTACVTDAADRYLIDLRLPAADSCPAA